VHLVDECYSLENKETNKQPQKSTNVSIVGSESNGDVLYVTTTNNRCAIEWVLDSTYTYHMCPHMDWFSTYELLDSGVVLMSNNAQCTMVDISIVQIKADDDIVRTLTNVPSHFKFEGQPYFTWNS